MPLSRRAEPNRCAHAVPSLSHWDGELVTHWFQLAVKAPPIHALGPSVFLSQNRFISPLVGNTYGFVVTAPGPGLARPTGVQQTPCPCPCAWGSWEGKVSAAVVSVSLGPASVKARA